MKQPVTRRMAFLFTFILLCTLFTAMPESASAAAKKPAVGSLKNVKIFFASHNKQAPMLGLNINYNTNGYRGKIYVKVYKGTKKIFSYSETIAGKGTYTTRNGTKALSLRKNNKPTVKPKIKYTVKVYVKTSAGKSKVLSKAYTPKL